MSTKYSKDLARLVRDYLERKEKNPPTLVVIEKLFEVMFFASLQREEAQPISCRVAFVDPENPDPEPPERITANRWNYFPLSEERKCQRKHTVDMLSQQPARLRHSTNSRQRNPDLANYPHPSRLSNHFRSRRIISCLLVTREGSREASMVGGKQDYCLRTCIQILSTDPLSMRVCSASDLARVAPARCRLPATPTPNTVRR
jgi:hypothetical protein